MLLRDHGTGVEKQNAMRDYLRSQGDEIPDEVMNSHSLIKTIGAVLGPIWALGPSGVTAEDLPPNAANLWRHHGGA